MFGEGGFDVGEIRMGQGADELAWESTFTYGTAHHQAVVKFDGDGALNQRISNMVVQALYSNSISEQLHLLAGARHDPRAPGKPFHAVAGFEAAVTERFSAESFVYLDKDGKLTGDAKLIYEQPITPHLLADARWSVAWQAQNIARDES